MHWTLQNILWASSWLLEISVATMMFLRGSWREYRIFWSYLVSEVLRTGLLLSISTDAAHYRTYFYSYWISELLICLLGFFVIREVFGSAFSGQLGLKQWGDRIFLWSLIALLAIACFSAANEHGGDSSRLLAAILVLKWAESFVRLGVLAALFISVLLLGLPWRHHAIGIAAGFAFYGSVELAMLAGRLHFGKRFNLYLIWMVMIAGLLENVIWAVYFVPAAHSKALGSASDDSGAATTSLVAAQEAAEAIWER